VLRTSKSAEIKKKRHKRSVSFSEEVKVRFYDPKEAVQVAAEKLS
jgi:hypothetical protein